MAKINIKAEMSSGMIIGIVLLIAGFVIILLIYSSLSLGEQKSREVCHNSIILRGSVPGALGARNFIPLSCPTEKICVRGKKLLGAGKCEEFENVEKVEYENVKETKDIEKLISDKIVDCWSMTGEGKLPLFSQFISENYGFGDIYPTCIICSRIAFNKTSIDKKEINLEDVDVENYMMTHNVPGTEETYFNYIAGEEGKISAREMFGITEEDAVQISKELEENANKEINELAILFMQISSPSHGKSAITLSGTIGGSILGISQLPFGGTGLRMLGKACTLGKFWGAVICGSIAIGGIGYQQINIFNQRSVAAEHCGDISTGSDAREGCSVVRAVPYDLDSIEKYCAIIESIP